VHRAYGMSIRSGRVTDDSTLAAYALLLMREAGRL
jgi:hypothetical protein